MPDLKDRIKSARSELKQLRQGGLRGDIKATTIEQQLDRIEDSVNRHRENNELELPGRVRDRLENRVEKVEKRIEKNR